MNYEYVVRVVREREEFAHDLWEKLLWALNGHVLGHAHSFYGAVLSGTCMPATKQS